MYLLAVEQIVEQIVEHFYGIFQTLIKHRFFTTMKKAPILGHFLAFMTSI